MDGETTPMMEDEVIENNGDYQGPSSLSSSEGGKIMGVVNQEGVMFSTQTGGENTAMGETEPEAGRPNEGWEMITYEGTSEERYYGLWGVWHLLALLCLCRSCTSPAEWLT